MAGVNGPNLNPVAGQVFTYTGSSDAESWEDVPISPTLENGTAPPANTLTGAETLFMTRGFGIIQATLSAIAAFVASVFTFVLSAWAGSVARSILARFLDMPISVKEFGATGNGTTDDTLAIQKAITALQGTGIDLLFPAGTYKVSNSLKVTALLNIAGSGRISTTFTGVLSGVPVFDIQSAQACYFRDIGFLGVTGATACVSLTNTAHMWELRSLLFRSCACPAILVDDSWDSEWFDIDILGASGPGGSTPVTGASVVFRNNCNNYHIYGLRIEQPAICGLFVGGTSNEISIFGGKVDGGFAVTSAYPAYVVQGNSQLKCHDVYWGGESNYHVSIADTSVVTCANCYFDGGWDNGLGTSAHVLMNVTWQIQHQTGQGGDSFQPVSGAFSATGCTFIGGSPFLSGYPRVAGIIYATMSTPIFLASNGTQFSPGIGGYSASTNQQLIGVGSGFTFASNDTANCCYLVAMSNGRTKRTKLYQTVTGGNALAFGAQTGTTLPNDYYQIEYAANHGLNVSIVGGYC